MSNVIDRDETMEAANVVERAVESLLAIVSSNGIAGNKIHGRKTNSVREEIHSILCSLARIRQSAKEHAK